MSASLLFERRFLKQFATVPSDYVPTSTLAEMFVERIANGWNVCDGVGLIPLLSTADENFYLYNPKLSLNKNRVVKMTFSVANLSDQIGVVARGKNTPCNGQGAMYNGGLLQSFRFYDSGGVTFQGFGNAWTATINTLYNLYGYARSTSSSDTTVKSWVTSTSNLLTHLVDGTTFTDSQADTQGNSSPNVTGFGPFTQSANDGTKVTRIQAWSVDGTFSACMSITSAGTGVTVEVFPVDNANSVTVQWYKSATATGTFTAISGATTSIYEYTGGTAGVKEHFKAILTDTVTGATATSEIMPGMKKRAALAIAMARDSWGSRPINADNSGTNNLGNMASYYAMFLGAFLNCDVTMVNGSVSGITAATFRDTYLTSHLAACATAGVTYAKVAFGANYTASDADGIVTGAQTATDDIEDIVDAYVAADITPIVSDAQCVLPYGRSGRGAFTSDMMDRINTNLQDVINGSSILEGDTGQNSFVAANAHALVDQLHLNETFNILLAAREAAIDAVLIDPAAIGASVPATANANTVTVGDLVTILRATCRNAGISDDDDTTYDLTQKHLAIQALLEDFARRTRCTRQVDEFTIDADDADVDLSDIVGFHTERITRIWIDGENLPLEVTDLERVNNSLAEQSGSSDPALIGFSTTSGVGQVFPMSGEARTGKVDWFTPITGWSAGDTSVSGLTVNIPADLARGAVYRGGIYFLQRNQPEHAAVIQQSLADYEAFVTRNIGSGALGIRATHRGGRPTNPILTDIQRERLGRFGRF